MLGVHCLHYLVLSLCLSCTCLGLKVSNTSAHRQISFGAIKFISSHDDGSRIPPQFPFHWQLPHFDIHWESESRSAAVIFRPFAIPFPPHLGTPRSCVHTSSRGWWLLRWQGRLLEHITLQRCGFLRCMKYLWSSLIHLNSQQQTQLTVTRI